MYNACITYTFVIFVMVKGFKPAVPPVWREPVRQPVSEPVRQPVREPVRQPVREPVRQPVREPVRQPVREPVRQPVREPVRQPVREPVRQPVREPVRQPVRQPVSQPVKNIWQERQQFVSEVLPQSVDEEEEMLRVAIEMSRLQMQEDALRREM